MTDEGGKFFEFQAKQAETLRVQMANLTLAWNNMLNEMGEGNQSLLSLPIKGLKVMLQNWSSLNRVLKNVILSIGLLKVAQMIAIRQQLAWAASTGTTAKMMGFLANSIKGVIAATKALFLNPWTWVFVGILAVTDLIGQWRAARKELAELNQEIKEGAGEASQSNLDFLNNKGNKATREAAKEGKLSAEQAAKAWESVEQQLLNSASSANSLLGELWAIDDVNQRVAKGFDYAERIQKAQAALQDLKDDTIKVSQDAGWWGMFGEGLQSDLKDFYEQLMAYKPKFQAAAEDFEEIYKSLTTQQGSRKDSDSAPDQRKEFLDELEVTAESINNFIKAYDIKDPLQINEILSRVKAQIKTRNPEIKGEMATLFDVSLDQRMSELTNGAVDKNASLWAMFMERLKHNSSATFQGITDEIYKESGKLSEEQQAAVDANLAYFKDSMPWYYNAVKSMVEDASQLKIHIGIAFNVQALTDFQKQVRDRISNASSALDFGSDAMLPTQNDNLQSWVKTQQGAIKSLQEQNKLYRKDSSQWAKDQIAANDREIQQRKNLLDLFNQSYAAEKKGGRGRKDVDIVAEALKQEIQLINDMRSNYDKLRKAGVSDTEAMILASKGYEMTILRINSILQKFGIDKFNAGNFAGKNVRELLDNLTKQRDALLASGKVKTSSLKDLDVMIQKLTVDAKTFDMKKITDGLNSELGKLKDEYELAIELDANPELGGMFADMFGINTSTLPKTFGDALDRAQAIINRKLAEMNITTPFDLMDGNIDSFAKTTGLDKDSAVIKELVSAQNTWRNMFKKNITETEKILDDYIKKYGDYSDKIAEIEAGRLEKLKKLNEAYYTEEMRKRPEYAAKLNAIEQGASKEKQQVDFDDFKNSRYYTMMFDNLDYISTKTIRDMRDRVRDLIDTMNDLTPEQLKTLMSQYEKLEQKLVKRSPFKTLTKDLKEYLSTSKERKAANQEFKNAQKEYDAQKKNVAALKEKYEQAKANSRTSKSYLDFLQIEISGENEVLQILKQQLDAAQKKADKYNLIKKLALEEASQVAQVVSSNLQSLGELRDFLQQDLGVELSDELNGLVDGLSKVGQGINKITSSATSGDIVGVITGVGQTIYGLYDGIASIFGGGGVSDKKTTKQIQDSERAVKRLELAYKNLEAAIEDAYGTNVIGAKQAVIANKELQLAELQRQLALEKSRDGKKRDDERIIELQGQIIDLQNDIKRSTQEITTELLGISSVGDAALNFMDAYISALRKGEDAQAAFTGSWKEMIANMIKQLWVTKVIGPQLEALVDDMNKRISERSKTEAEAYQRAVNEKTRLSGMNGKEILAEMMGIDVRFITWDMVEQYKDVIDAYVSSANANVEKTKKELDKATIPTIEDMDMVAQAGEDLLPLLQASEEQLNELLKKYGLYDDQSDKTLSALQQGIQGITEDTAGALEGYMNGISQQVYLQSEYLRQIVEFINIDADPMDDIKVASLSQILLQLRDSYQVQLAIQSRLDNWSNANGMAVRVEMI